MRQGFFIGVLLAASLVMAGCSSSSESGLNILARSVPDEFAVVKRKPLTVPPDFALRPPEESDRTSQVALTDTVRLAQSALLGNTEAVQNAQPARALDADDFALLQKAEADKAEDNIRRIVDQESTDLIYANRNYVRELLSFLFDEELPGKVVDPKEAERAVRQRVLVASTPDGAEKATIVRAKEDSGFDWDKLWPF